MKKINAILKYGNRKKPTVVTFDATEEVLCLHPDVLPDRYTEVEYKERLRFSSFDKFMPGGFAKSWNKFYEIEVVDNMIDYLQCNEDDEEQLNVTMDDLSKGLYHYYDDMGLDMPKHSIKIGPATWASGDSAFIPISLYDVKTGNIQTLRTYNSMSRALSLPYNDDFTNSISETEQREIEEVFDTLSFNLNECEYPESTVLIGDGKEIPFKTAVSEACLDVFGFKLSPGACQQIEMALTDFKENTMSWAKSRKGIENTWRVLGRPLFFKAEPGTFTPVNTLLKDSIWSFDFESIEKAPIKSKPKFEGRLVIIDLDDKDEGSDLEYVYIDKSIQDPHEAICAAAKEYAEKENLSDFPWECFTDIPKDITMKHGFKVLASQDAGYLRVERNELINKPFNNNCSDISVDDMDM